MKLFVNGKQMDLPASEATVRRTSDRLQVSAAEGVSSALAVRKGDAVLISYRGRQYTVERALARGASAAGVGTGELRAPMPGLIVEVFVAEGQRVAKGLKVLVLEAMKTQQSFVAPFDGVVEQIAVQRGQQVAEGSVMMLVKAHEVE